MLSKGLSKILVILAICLIHSPLFSNEADFISYCVSAERSSAEHRTLRVLGRQNDLLVDDTGFNEEFCQKLETILSSSKELYFGGENPIHPFAEGDGIWTEHISDIQLFRYFPNIEILSLSGNDIGDWSPIKSLKHLRELSIVRSQLEDLRFVAELESLEYLDVRNTRVRDLKPIAQLSKLRKLGISGTRVVSLDVLDQKVIRNLELLWMDFVALTDWSVLEHAINLVHVRVSSSNIPSLKIFKNSKKIQVLVANDNPHLETLEGIRNFPELKALGLASSSVLDFSQLMHCPNIQNLRLDQSRISDFSFLNNLPNLRELSIKNTPDLTEENLRVFLDITTLKVLDIRGCNIDPNVVDKLYAKRKLLPAQTKEDQSLPQNELQIIL